VSRIKIMSNKTAERKDKNRILNYHLTFFLP
jgi:hypothetical protein